MLNFRNSIIIFCVLFIEYGQWDETSMKASMWVTANQDDLLIVGTKLDHFQKSLMFFQNEGILNGDKYANIWKDWPETSSEFKKAVVRVYNPPDFGQPTFESGHAAYAAVDTVCQHIVNGLKEIAADSNTCVNELQKLYDTGKFLGFLAFWGNVPNDLIEMEIRFTRETNPFVSRMRGQIDGILAAYRTYLSITGPSRD